MYLTSPEADVHYRILHKFLTISIGSVELPGDEIQACFVYIHGIFCKLPDLLCERLHPATPCGGQILSES
jgi:hypothetical protein